MIAPVNVSGKVYIDKQIKKLIEKSDFQKLKNCAKETNSDIFVINHEKQKDGTNIYETIVDKFNKKTNQFDEFSYIFGFKKN